jgi:predicted Zn-dependent peptidase
VQLIHGPRLIAYDFDSLGASFNAYTSREVTSYHSKVLREYTEKSLEILVDMFENSIFDGEELERERGVILQELAMYNDTPDEIIYDYYQSTVFRNQIFGQSIIGTAENIGNFQRQDFIDYMNNNYVTDNIVLSMAGHIEYERALDMANGLFKKKRKKTRDKLEKAEYSGGYFKKIKDLEQVQCIFGFRGIPFDSEDRFVMPVMNTILGQGMSSRLFQEVREKKGLCYTIRSSNEATFETGSFYVYTAVEPKCLNEALDAIISEIRKMTSNVNPEELERAKIQAKSSILMGLESTVSRASSNAIKMICLNKIETTNEIIDSINRVTIDDVEQLLGRIIAGDPGLSVYGSIGDVYDYATLREKCHSNL